MPRPNTLTAFALVCLGHSAASQEPVDLWGGLDRGAYGVGFKVIEVRDPARRLASGEHRPIQISIWYPARRVAGDAAMRYEDYVRVTASETSLRAASADEERATLDRYRGFLGRNGLSAEAIRAWLGARMAATKDGEPAAGRFPLAIIAQGMGGAVPDQSLLGEYLANHGWVAATSPSQLRLGDEARDEKDLFKAADQQARDLAVILARMGSFPATDARRLSVIGYSFGARSALLFALRTPAVKALVSIDGGIANRNGRDWLNGRGGTPAGLKIPLLHFFEDADEAIIPDFGLLASLKRSDRLILKVAAMRHLDFIALGMARAVIPGVTGGPVPDRELEKRFQAVLRYTRAFLDARVEGSEGEAAFLASDPSVNNFGDALPRVIRMPRGH